MRTKTHLTTSKTKVCFCCKNNGHSARNFVRRESQAGQQHRHSKGNVGSVKQRGTAVESSARKAQVQAERARASSLLLSSLLPTPAQFVATCTPLTRPVALAEAPVMQCEAIYQFTWSDIVRAFVGWYDHRGEGTNDRRRVDSARHRPSGDRVLRLTRRQARKEGATLVIQRCDAATGTAVTLKENRGVRSTVISKTGGCYVVTISQERVIHARHRQTVLFFIPSFVSA